MYKDQWRVCIFRDGVSALAIWCFELESDCIHFLIYADFTSRVSCSSCWRSLCRDHQIFGCKRYPVTQNYKVSVILCQCSVLWHSIGHFWCTKNSNVAPRLEEIKQNKLIILLSISKWFLLFKSPKPRSQVWILVYRKWPVGGVWSLPLQVLSYCHKQRRPEIILSHHKVFFNWVSKVSWDWIGVALLLSVIGLENSRHSLNQSDAKLNNHDLVTCVFPCFK